MDGKLIVAANRLPVSAETEGSTITARQSDGGLVSGLSHLTRQEQTIWVGCPAIHSRMNSGHSQTRLETLYSEHGCFPVWIEKEVMKEYYDGFSNSTLWPLFHGFTQNVRLSDQEWKSYEKVNNLFLQAIDTLYEPGDILWIHDYHLMLLPSLLRQTYQNAQIGFFLHIPFPNFEIFRMLPQKAKLLKGLIGSDLIGFHTYDYVRYFLDSVRKTIGIDDKVGVLEHEGRNIKVDAFPMGINFNVFSTASATEAVQNNLESYRNEKKRQCCKTMLSVERLDYTKGVPELLEALEKFFEQYPEWIENLVVTVALIPSREGVGPYRSLKKKIESLVGKINGKYATHAWTPIEYYYRSIPQDVLCTLYASSDVMLVTPLRDGMNLVCKEYLASRIDGDGVLILSEMAGAVYELGDALLVNPFDQQQMVETIHKALLIPTHEQQKRNASMLRRLKRYTSQKWTSDFLNDLAIISSTNTQQGTKKFGEKIYKQMIDSFAQSQHAALLLDYDGTLVPFTDNPMEASPDTELLSLLTNLGAKNEVDLVLISGRNKETLNSWFPELPLDIIAEHGIWRKRKVEDSWIISGSADNAWKSRIYPILENFVDRTPGSFIEEKSFSLVWHYRTCGKNVGERRSQELRTMLSDEMAALGLSMLDGNKVIEIKPAGISKGTAANLWLMDNSYDFFLVIGDDATDEDMFSAAPDNAWTIKVGTGPTSANYSLRNYREVRTILFDLAAHKED